jgi:hypothetical protein
MAYRAALAQLRLGIKRGGFGLTSQKLVAPAVLLVAIRDFKQWLVPMSLVLSWSQSASTSEVLFPSTEFWKQQALGKVRSYCIRMPDNVPHHVIKAYLKEKSFQELSDLLKELSGDNVFLLYLHKGSQL